MPTGHTSNLYNGKAESFEDFVLACARGMGAFIHQRDDSSCDKPALRTPSAYHAEAVAKDEAALNAWNKAGDDDKYDQWRGYENDTNRANRDRRAKNEALRFRYDRRLKEVKAWSVPERLQSFKDFMIDQIESSIKFDCSDYQQDVLEYDEWADQQAGYLLRSLESSQKSFDADIKRCAEQNQYAAALYTALNLEVPR